MSLKYQVMLLWAICSMHKVVVSSNEVVLVERNVTDSFRVGKDGCRSDTNVCTSSATCQLDTGMCLCKEDSPHFLNYVKENFSQYRCVSTEDMKHHIGKRFVVSCSLIETKLLNLNIKLACASQDQTMGSINGMFYKYTRITITMKFYST